MRGSTDSAYFMTSNAQGFARPAVTTCTDFGFSKCSRSVIIACIARAEPASRVWIRAPVFRGNTFARVTTAANTRRMTSRAQSWIRARFFAMARRESRAMYTHTCWIVKKDSFWQKRGRCTMTTQARSFRMTIHAKLPLRRRANSVFSYEITGMNKMVVRTNALVTQIHMARITSILCEFFFVRMAASAGRHSRSQDFGTIGDIHVTSHAIAVHPWHMRSMFEPQKRSRHFGALFGLRQSMTTAAFMIVVRFFMTIEAILCGRQMQRPFFACRCSASVTTTAMNSFEHVRSMLECASARRSNAENGRASSREKQRSAKQERRRG